MLWNQGTRQNTGQMKIARLGKRGFAEEQNRQRCQHAETQRINRSAALFSEANRQQTRKIYRSFHFQRSNWSAKSICFCICSPTNSSPFALRFLSAAFARLHRSTRNRRLKAHSVLEAPRFAAYRAASLLCDRCRWFLARDTCRCRG